MKNVILNEEKYNLLATEVVSVAKSLLNDDGDYLSNISQLNSLRFEIGGNEYDEDFEIFIVIISETDHIPYGKARNNCSKAWLAQCDEELSEVKELYREHIEKSCKSIVKRFAKGA